MKSKILLVLVSLFFAVNAKAQWSVGFSAGWDYNFPSITKGYATDVEYKAKSGFDINAMGSYQFAKWFAVRADLRLNTRNYTMERNYYRFMDVYTDHRDTYLHLPVVADFSFGGEKLRGHCYLGAYVGYWLSAHRKGNAIQEDTEKEGFGIASFDERMEFDSRRDKRFNAGLTGGIGISYLVARNWEILADALLMYDLTKSNVTYMLANPRYNSTVYINVGFMYKF